MAVLSKGAEFYFATYSGSTLGNYTKVKGMIDVPDLGVVPNKVDITTLDDEAYHYMKGLKDYGDLDFTFLYDDETYALIKNVESEAKVGVKVVLPAVGTQASGRIFIFDAQVSAALSGFGVEERLEFTVSCALQSDITETAAA